MRDPIYLYFDKDGHHKFYDMIDNGDDTFTAHWGKIETEGKTTVYPLSQWYKKYADKIEKGYDESNVSYGAWIR